MNDPRGFIAGVLIGMLGLTVWMVYDIKHELSKPAAAKACVVKPRVML